MVSRMKSAGKALAGKAKKLGKSTSTGPLTRGGLEPAMIKTSETEVEPLSPAIEAHFLFNPTDYKLSKSNTWSDEAPGHGKKKAKKEFSFTKMGRVKLSLTLHFDTLMAPESREKPYDVRYHTDDLWRMMERKKAGQPPPQVEFHWGGLIFKSFIDSMDQKFTLFREDGVPVRCEVTITLTQFDPESSMAIEGIAAPKPVKIKLSSRADLIASLSLGMAAMAAGAVASTASTVADQTRKIMENNAIDNPLVLATGSEVNTDTSDTSSS